MDLKEYKKIWTDKVIQADRNFASMHLMDNVVSKDDPLIGQFVSKLMSGGTRVRQYPMIGTDQSTYKPAIHATNELVGISGGISGGKKKNGITTNDVMDFGKGFQQGFVAPFQMVGDAATAIAPAVALASASGGAKGAIELEKAKEIVVLGDNVGEHIFDYMFIEVLQELYPHVKYTYMVRGQR